MQFFAAESSQMSANQVYSWAEVAEHKGPDSYWFVVDDKVRFHCFVAPRDPVGVSAESSPHLLDCAKDCGDAFRFTT
jgi:hypothetical protein